MSMISGLIVTMMIILIITMMIILIIMMMIILVITRVIILIILLMFREESWFVLGCVMAISVLLAGLELVWSLQV